MATVKNHAGKRWTKARYRQFIRSALRSAFRKWPVKFDVLKNAKTEVRLNPSSGRMAMHYRCATCKHDFPMKQVQVDHIKPIGKLVSWDTFIKRLYCEARNLQVVCRPCHAIKTKKERYG